MSGKREPSIWSRLRSRFSRSSADLPQISDLDDAGGSNAESALSVPDADSREVEHSESRLRFTCSCCGEVHVGAPSFGFNEPASFLSQTATVREAGVLNSDFCTYSNEDGEFLFARTVLEVPIHGSGEPFLWGVWVSLSAASYADYSSGQCEQEGYFGWFCNRLPYYEDTLSLAMDVVPRSGGIRPALFPHDGDHELVRDFQEGLSQEKAARIAEVCMHPRDD